MTNPILSMSRLLAILSLVFMLGFFTACDEDDLFQETDYSTVPDAPDTSDAQHEVKLIDIGDEEKVELNIYIHEEGEGNFEVSERDMVLVRYTMRSIVNGEMEIHDSTWANGSTSPTDLNMATLIPGVRHGMMGMREGGERTIIIPPELGYQDDPNHELYDKKLHFHVELDQVLDD